MENGFNENMVVRFLQGTAKQRLPTVEGKHRSEAKVYGFSFHAFPFDTWGYISGS